MDQPSVSLNTANARARSARSARHCAKCRRAAGDAGAAAAAAAAVAGTVSVSVQISCSCGRAVLARLCGDMDGAVGLLACGIVWWTEKKEGEVG